MSRPGTHAGRDFLWLVLAVVAAGATGFAVGVAATCVLVGHLPK